MEQCEIVRTATTRTDQERRSALFSAKGRNARKFSNGATQKVQPYHHMPIFSHGSTTLKTPGPTHASKNMTFRSQATDRVAIAQTLDNTIHSGAAAPTPAPRLEAGPNRGAFRTIVSGAHHRRVQSSDYHSLQLTAAHGRNAKNATAVAHPQPIGLNDSFNTPASLNLATTSSKKGKMVSNKFEQLQVGTFNFAENQTKGVKYAHMA